MDRPVNRVFLGYSFTIHRQTKIRVPEKTCQKMRAKVTVRFRQARGQNVARFIRETLNPLLRGCMNYFRLSEPRGFAAELDGWIRRRLRGVIGRQWKRPATRFKRLRALGLDEARARASGHNGRWRVVQPWRFPTACRLPGEGVYRLGPHQPARYTERLRQILLFRNRWMREPHVRWCEG